MKAKIEQFSDINLNPVLSVSKDGIVLYSNKASQPLLNKWCVKVGEKLPSYIGEIIERVISLNNPEKMEIKVGKRVYLAVFHPSPEQECVYISGFDINYQKKLDQRLLHLLNGKLEASSRELRKLNEALISSESKYWHIVENSNDGIWILDRHDRTVFVNQKVSKMLGYSSYEICGYSPKKFLAPKFRSLVDDRLRKYRQKVEKFNDYQFIRKDGSDLWCIVSTHQLFDDEGKYNGSLCMLIDISERKEAEEKLRESEERYRNIVETANEGIYLVNNENIVTYANQKIAELSGYKLEEVIGRPVLDFVSEESKLIAKENLEKRRIGVSKSYELKLLRKDGTLLWVILNSKPFFNKEGKFTGYLGMLTDINERKIAEEKLRENEEKYRNIVEIANEGIGINDSEFKITYANKRMADMLGYTLEEGIGRSIWDFLSEESKAIVKLNLKKKQLGIDSGYELKFIRKDGSPIWTHMNSKPLLDKEGNYLGSVSMFTDITKRKEAEEKLRESEQKYRNIIETTNEGIVIIDAEFRITYVNNRLMEKGGYSQEEIIGKLWWDFTDEEGKAAAKSHMDKRQRGIDEIHELRLICKDGSSFWALVSSKSLFDDYGKFSGSLSMLTDITERKEAEERLRESEEKYRNIVEIANEGILVIDSKLRVTFYNQKLMEMLGYDSEEGIGRPIWDFIKEDSKSSVKLNMKKRERGITENYELELICKDGSSLWVLLNSKSLFDKDRKFMGSISVISDINERKRVEGALANIRLPK